MDLFNEIDNNKKEFPKLNKFHNDVKNIKLNFYQKFSIAIFIFCLIFGVILGNLFPACSSSIGIYSDTCENPEFNSFLMIIFWFVSFIGCTVFFGMGHIINLLTEIKENSK